CRKFRGRVVERVDEKRVVEPQMQAHPEHYRERYDALQAGDERLLDTACELQITPNHDVYGAERDHGRLENGRDPRGIVADIGRKLGVQPYPECLEEFHESFTCITVSAEIAPRTRPGR